MWRLQGSMGTAWLRCCINTSHIPERRKLLNGGKKEREKGGHHKQKYPKTRAVAVPQHE